jgi:hypothetical protein
MVFSSLLVSAMVTPQKVNSDWTKWSKKEAEKMLADSPWSQTQTETNTSEMFFSPTSDPNLANRKSTSTDDSRLSGGANNQAVNIKYLVRFFSARPIRRALVRMMELQQTLPEETVTKLHNFADVKSADSIILTLSIQSTDQRAERATLVALNNGVTAVLKNDTYLERNGKRLFLEEYIPPGKDGFGARFIFLRLMDEKPFIEDKSGEVRFVTKFPKGPAIDKRFKVSDMIYEGELEY